MKKIKCRLLFILTLILLLNTITNAGVYEYTDDSDSTVVSEKPSSWAEEQVNQAIAKRLVPKSLQSKYTQAITRSEFCALAVALYENIKGEITGLVTFNDTKDINVQKAAFINVVSGVGNNRFDPDTSLTREQAAVMLSRLSDAIGKPFPKQTTTFADNTKISSWAIEGVGRVQKAEIMSGVGNNRFAPQDPYTREQSIITIMRTFTRVTTPQMWVLEKIEIFDDIISGKELQDIYLLGMPYLGFYDGDIIEIGNFATVSNYDAGTITGLIEYATYTINVNNIIIVGGENSTILNRNGDIITWNMNGIIMQFRKQ